MARRKRQVAEPKGWTGAADDGHRPLDPAAHDHHGGRLNLGDQQCGGPRLRKAVCRSRFMSPPFWSPLGRPWITQPICFAMAILWLIPDRRIEQAMDDEQGGMARQPPAPLARLGRLATAAWLILKNTSARLGCDKCGMESKPQGMRDGGRPIQPPPCGGCPLAPPRKTSQNDTRSPKS